MIAAGLLILGVSVFVTPHLNASVFNNPMGSISVQNIPSFVSGVLEGVGSFGLISGLIVLGSGVMLRVYPNQSVLFGLLIVIFSILGFLGTGGFVIGAVLGIAGGIMTLRWRGPAPLAQVASMSATAGQIKGPA